MKDKQAQLEEKLKVLKHNFKSQLQQRMVQIRTLWKQVQDNVDAEQLKELHRQLHSLAGSGGTYGADSVSHQARIMEQMIRAIIDQDGGSQITGLTDDLRQQLEHLLEELEHLADRWHPDRIHYCCTAEQRSEQQQNMPRSLIYLMEDDHILGEKLSHDLQQMGFEVQHFTQLKAFEQAMREQMPTVILMDIVLAEGEIAGAQAISRMKSENTFFPPVIFMSVRNDMVARLAAARAGADRYFAKPLDMEKLSQTLRGLTMQTAISPYRVLAIDDDAILLDYYKTVLTHAGLEVLTLNRPLQTLEVLHTFRPDVILVDLYMPECSGAELAEVIRQDDSWSLIPIVYLSSENDLSRQLHAMNQGGDDFLVKPVKAEHLEAAVVARAKRARWTTRLREALKKSERDNSFQLVTMNQHAIVCTTDTNGRITYVNDKFCTISGYSREDLLGQTFQLLHSGEHEAEFFSQMWQTLRRGEVWQGVICNRNREGEHYWVDATIVPFLDYKNQPYKYVSVQTDITAIRISERKYISLFEFSDTANFILVDGKITECNQTAVKMFASKDTQTLQQQHIGSLFPPIELENGTIDIDQQLASTHSKEQQHYHFEWRIRRLDGSFFDADVSLTHIPSEKDYFQLLMVRDITIQHRYQQELVEAREAAIEANKAKSQFLASMSHELRTPLNAIIGFAQLLQMDTRLSEHQKDNINEITTAGQHLLSLINEVLDLAKIESGHIELSIDEIRLGELLAESLQLVQPQIDAKKIQVILENEGKTVTRDSIRDDPTIIKADYTRLKQVMLNLLSNAIKYNCDAGRLTLSFRRIDGRKIRVAVTDTGKGMTEKQLSRLFRPFERLGMEHSEVEGTGIGLVFSDSLLRLMGSRIEVSSIPDQGSTFWFDLQYLDEQSNLDELKYSASDDRLDVSGNSVSESGDKPFTILYIEDNPANLRLIAQLLEHYRHVQLLTAREPLAGLELARNQQPQLILLDISLPVMDGYQVLRELKSSDTTRNIMVFALSAKAMEDDIDKALRAGFDRYITKPINVPDFLDIMDQLLQQKAHRV